MQRKALSIVDIVLGAVCVLELAGVLYLSVLAYSQNPMLATFMNPIVTKAAVLSLMLAQYWFILLPFLAAIVLSVMLVFGKKSAKVDETIGLVCLLIAGVPVAICLFVFFLSFLVWLAA